jgi:hypothetical protein
MPRVRSEMNPDKKKIATQDRRVAGSYDIIEGSSELVGEYSRRMLQTSA